MTYAPNYDVNIGSMSEVAKIQEEKREEDSKNGVLRGLEKLTKCFMVRPLLSSSRQDAAVTLGSIKVVWSTPEIDKPKGLVYNETIIVQPAVDVVDCSLVTSCVVVPSQCKLGEGFDMTLVVVNRGRFNVPITFVVSNGGNFYCAGRTRGGHTIQPMSTSRTHFRLIGMTPGNVSLPGIIAEREGGEQLINESDMGRIQCFP